MTKRLLLICGILAPLLYMGSDLIAAMRYEGYSLTAQAVSELRALGAPTRPFLLPILYLYSMLEITFGVGVWGDAGRQRSLRITGALLIALGVVDLIAPVFPMHVRGAGATLTDTMHILLTSLTVLLLLLIVVFGAGANGKGFRFYSYFTLLLILGGGVLAGFDSARLAANTPTPWLGVTERFNIYGYMVWLLALAVVLLRTKTTSPQEHDVSWIKKHSVLLYFVLTFVISWGGILLVIGGPGAIPGTPAETASLFGIGIAMMLLGPSVMGLVMTALVDSKAGMRDFRARLLKWRVGIRWYMVALLATPLLLLVTLLALWFASPVFLPGIFATNDKLSLLLTGITIGLAAGIFEELGWTGFAIHHLRQHFSVVRTGLVVGFLWGAWHYLAAFWASGDARGAFLPSQLMLQMFFYIAVLPAYRVLMVWVYDHTESLLLAMLMHASLTGGVLFIFMPLALPWVPLLTWYVVLAALLWLAVAAIAMAQRQDSLGGQPPKDQVYSQTGGHLPQHS